MRKTKNILTIIGLILILNPVVAQRMVTITDGSTMFVHGTSTLHDWTSEVQEFSGSAKLSTDGTLNDISSLTVSVKVESIESGKGKMDDLTYEALESEDHPYIRFELNEIKSIGNGKVTAKGDVTIAGAKRAIEVSGDYQVNGNEIMIKGKKTIDMTEFNIEPPTAMFGTIVVGEEVTVEYNLKLK